MLQALKVGLVLVAPQAGPVGLVLVGPLAIKVQLAIKVLLEILALKVLKVLKGRHPSAARGVTKDLKIMLRLLQAAYKN